MKKIVVFVAAVVLISSSIHAMQHQSYKPAMQDMQHKFAMNKKHSSKMEKVFSTNQVQLAALAKKAQVKDEQTAKFYRMPCKTGTALVALTAIMCLAALPQARGDGLRENEYYRAGMEYGPTKYDTTWSRPPVYDGRRLPV